MNHAVDRWAEARHERHYWTGCFFPSTEKNWGATHLNGCMWGRCEYKHDNCPFVRLHFDRMCAAEWVRMDAREWQTQPHVATNTSRTNTIPKWNKIVDQVIWYGKARTRAHRTAIACAMHAQDLVNTLGTNALDLTYGGNPARKSSFSREKKKKHRVREMAQKLGHSRLSSWHCIGRNRKRKSRVRSLRLSLCTCLPSRRLHTAFWIMFTLLFHLFRVTDFITRSLVSHGHAPC